jgi:hypothetical protein
MSNPGVTSRYHDTVAEVSDIDDTLVLTDAALKAATKAEFGTEMSRAEVRKLPKEVKRRFLATAYSQFAGLLVPNEHWITEFNISQACPGHTGVVLSARTEAARAPTEALLRRVGVSFEYLILSPPVITHDEEFKAEALLDLVGMFDEVRYYEDKLENLEFILKHYPEVCAKKLRLFLVDSLTVGEIH